MSVSRLSERQWERRVLEYASYMTENALAPDFMERLVDLFHEDHGGKVGLLRYEPDRSLAAPPVVKHLDEWFTDSYQQYYKSCNPWAESVYTNNMQDSTYVTSRFVPRTRLWRTEYYNDLLRAVSVEYCLGTSLQLPDGGRVSISSYRGDEEGGDFDGTDVRRTEMLRPFLRQALRLRQIHTADGSSMPLVSTAELLRPVILVLENGSVKPLNEAGEEYLRTRRLNGKNREALRRALEADGTELVGPAAMAAGRVQGRGGVTAIIGQDDRTCDDKRTRLASLFGLTPRESEVAVELLRGDAYSAVADRLAISTETVRTFVRSIHRKSGVSSTKRFIRMIEDLF